LKNASDDRVIRVMAIEHDQDIAVDVLRRQRDARARDALDIF
jgi:hypothetical protein